MPLISDPDPYGRRLRRPPHDPMPYAPQRHHRRSIRLEGYDYTGAGAYFITIGTCDRLPLFGTIAQGDMRLSEFGAWAEFHWQDLANHHPNVDLDEFIVMPDHMHGIIVLDGSVRVPRGSPVPSGATQASPLRPTGPPPGSLGAIVGSFKSAVARRINAARKTPGTAVWHRDYYEHIIRNDGSLDRIRTYIRDNPMNWKQGRIRGALN